MIDIAIKFKSLNGSNWIFMLVNSPTKCTLRFSCVWCIWRVIIKHKLIWYGNFMWLVKFRQINNQLISFTSYRERFFCELRNEKFPRFMRRNLHMKSIKIKFLSLFYLINSSTKHTSIRWWIIGLAHLMALNVCSTDTKSRHEGIFELRDSKNTEISEMDLHKIIIYAVIMSDVVRWCF